MASEECNPQSNIFHSPVSLFLLGVKVLLSTSVSDVVNLCFSMCILSTITDRENDRLIKDKNGNTYSGGIDVLFKYILNILLLY
jgi:hypothetical protein